MLESNYTILWPAANSTIELVAIKWPYPSWNLFTSNSFKKKNCLLVYFSFHERYVVVLCSNFQRPETRYVWTGKLLFANHCALSEQYWYMLSLLRLHKDFFLRISAGQITQSFILCTLRWAKPAIFVDKCVIVAHVLLCFNPVFISLTYMLFIKHEVNLDS